MKRKMRLFKQDIIWLYRLIFWERIDLKRKQAEVAAERCEIECPYFW